MGSDFLGQSQWKSVGRHHHKTLVQWWGGWSVRFADGRPAIDSLSSQTKILKLLFTDLLLDAQQ